MDEDYQDDSFADDIDLDDLPADALEELEEKAVFISTQARNHVASHGYAAHETSSDYGLEDEDVIDLGAPVSFAHTNYVKLTGRPGDDVSGSEKWRQQGYGRDSHDLMQRDTLRHESKDDLGQAVGAFAPMSVNKAQPEYIEPMDGVQEQQIDVSALQARIHEVTPTDTAARNHAYDLSSLNKKE